MATRKEEEEHPFADFDFGSASSPELSEDYYNNFDFNSGGSGSAFDYSIDRLMRASGRGLSELLPRMGTELPLNVKDYAGKMQQAGEQGMEEYIPEYEGGIFDQSLSDMPGFIGEKLAENGAASAITMFGLTLGQNLMMKGPGATKLIGAGITGAAAGLNYLMLLDEAVETHAAADNKTVDELTDKEIGRASWTAIQNAGLDFVLPNVWARSLNKAGLPAKKSFKQIAKNLKETDKEKIGAMLYKGAKQTAQSAGIEGATETAQQINTMRTSALGLEGLDKNDLATDFVVGAAGGGVYGSPVALSKATDVNRSRKKDKLILDFEDARRKAAAGEQYTLNVDQYNKQYDELLKQFNTMTGAGVATAGVGPVVRQPDAMVNIRPPKKDIDANVEDVIPELFNAEADPKGFLTNIKDAAANVLLRRATDGLPDIRNKVQTGKEMAAFMSVASPITDVSTGSGESQDVSKSFETLRHKYIGDYINKFEKVKNKWTRHVALMGEMASSVRPSVNKYIAAKLEEGNASPLYNLQEAEVEVTRALGKRKKKELDASIKDIADIQESIYQALTKTLGKDGLTIGHQEGYLSRGIDYKKVKKNPERFKESLVKDVGLSTVEADLVLQNVLNDVDPNVFTSEQIRAEATDGGMGISSFERARDGKWDNLSPEFRNEDTLDSIERYLFSAVTRMASAEAFGGDKANKYNDAINTLIKSGAVDSAQVEKLWGIYDAYHNVYKKPKTPEQRAAIQAMKGLSTVTSISYLGLATISSWTEPMWIGQRAGWYNMLKASPTVAGYALKGLARSIYGGAEGKDARTSFGRDLLRVMGMAMQPQMSERIDKLMAGDRNVALNYFFRSPGAMFLTQYTNAVRVWTAAAGLNMIQDQLNNINNLSKTKKRLLLQELKENGLSMSDFEKVGALANGNIKNAILDDSFLDSTFVNSKGNTISVRDVMIPWMRKITTDVALEPTAGNRPLWMSDPNLMLIAQLKSFPILFGNTIARRVNAKLNPKFCSSDFVGKMAAISSISAAIGMAALAMAIKDAIKGVEEERGVLETVSAVGIPLIGELGDAKVAGYIAGPGPAYVDGFLKKIMGDEPIGDTAEEMYKIFLNATTGRIGQEYFLGD